MSDQKQTADGANETAPEATPLIPTGILTTLDAFKVKAMAWVSGILRLPEGHLPEPADVVATVSFPRNRPVAVKRIDRDTQTEQDTKPILHDFISAGKHDLGNFHSKSGHAYLMVSPLAGSAEAILTALTYAVLDLAFPPERYTDKTGQEKMRQRTAQWKAAAETLGIKPVSREHYYDSPHVNAFAADAVKLLPKFPKDSWATLQRTMVKAPTNAETRNTSATCPKGHIALQTAGARILKKADVNATANGLNAEPSADSKAPILCGLCFMLSLRDYKGPEIPAEAAQAVRDAILASAIIEKPKPEATKTETKTTTKGKGKTTVKALPASTSTTKGRKRSAA